MPQGNAKLVRYAGGRDVWGGHGIFFAKYTGPTSYVNSGVATTSGEIIDSIGGTTELGAAQAPLRNIDAIPPVVSVSGLYMVVFMPSAAPVTGLIGAGNAPKRWFARWFTIIGMVEVVNAVNLSAQSAVVMLIGG